MPPQEGAPCCPSRCPALLLTSCWRCVTLGSTALLLALPRLRALAVTVPGSHSWPCPLSALAPPCTPVPQSLQVHPGRCSSSCFRLVPSQPDRPGGRACARGHLAAAAQVEGALLSPPLEDRAHWAAGLGSRSSPCFPEPEVSHCCCLFISSCKCAPRFGECHVSPSPPSPRALPALLLPRRAGGAGAGLTVGIC